MISVLYTIYDVEYDRNMLFYSFRCKKYILIIVLKEVPFITSCPRRLVLLPAHLITGFKPFENDTYYVQVHVCSFIHCTISWHLARSWVFCSQHSCSISWSQSGQLLGFPRRFPFWRYNNIWKMKDKLRRYTYTAYC